MFLETYCSTEKTINGVNSQKTHILFQISCNKGTKNKLQRNTRANPPALPKSSLTSIEKLKVVIKYKHRQTSGGRNCFGKKKRRSQQKKKGTLNKIIRAQIGVDFQSRQTWSILSIFLLNFIRKYKIKHPAVTTQVFTFFHQLNCNWKIKWGQEKMQSRKKSSDNNTSVTPPHVCTAGPRLFLSLSFSRTHMHTLELVHANRTHTGLLINRLIPGHTDKTRQCKKSFRQLLQK